ncbi:endonuclease [Thermasporomyces composti]|jgi:endonuclease III|uniref:Endonuclease III n=1 Tax=Thermasporomyces composti TaxID=696763 RepID=A0A3D9V2Q8_THECX|nr:endonuclease [Thermasporomyces composti]REF35789.1 endonuclease III [Thermasporomyces composti]
MATATRTAHALLDRHGRTYADEADIRLRDTPGPLYQLLVLATLLSARISAGIAVAAARELFRAGYRSAATMRDASWQDRVDTLGRGHYRRYDERTATMLGRAAEVVLEQWRGDLRRLHAEGGDVDGVSRLLQSVPGIGPTGAAIFCREVQGVWPDLAPYVDTRAARGAERLGLPASPTALARLVPTEDLPRLVAGCVRASLSKDVVEDVQTGV